MNTEQRAYTLTKFMEHLEVVHPGTSEKYISDINELQFNEDNLPKMDVVEDLITYHKDITSTIQGTYNEVRDVMLHMKQLKNRKKNVQVVIDSMTSCLEIKRLYYGLGKQPKQIHSNLEVYYQIRGKVYHMDKYIDRIQRDIAEIQKQYQQIFDKEMSKNNSSSIGEISKILQLIRTHAGESSKPDTCQQIADLCVNNAKKEFKDIEESLFAVPIVGNSESNYMFFDMAKNSMKIIVSLAGNCKNNVHKVSGQQGYIHVIKTLFQLVTSGIIFEILMRLRKYYEVQKIVINQSKFALKEKEFKQLQPFFKEYVAIWNQLQRLRIHLIDEISDSCSKKYDLKMSFEEILNNTKLLQINTNSITLMQAMMRFRFDKLLKKNRFIGCICTMDSQFFKEVNDKNLVHNTHAQDFLEETMNSITEGIEKALETLNILVISAIINFTNTNLIYQDVFYAFNQLFSRTFSKLPSSDPRVQNAMLLTLNAISAFPRALKLLVHLKLPEELPEERIKTQLQQVINNNEDKTLKVLQGMIERIVSAEWFHFQLEKDYEKILDKWMNLQNDCFSVFVQQVCKVHAEIIIQTQFSKKYTHTTAINFERDIRAKISFYERYSHSILPNFKKILDYIEILQLDSQDDLQDTIERLKGAHSEADLKRIWSLRS